MIHISSYCRIIHGQVIINGKTYFEAENKTAHEFLSELYTFSKIDYRKFYKMDLLSKLGFLASEILLDNSILPEYEYFDKKQAKENFGIALFNANASLEADCKFQNTINFFPSPSDFVYTLPNIVIGEIAIRNKILGETAFYVTKGFQADKICEIVNNMNKFAGMREVLTGWCDVNPFAETLDCLMIYCKYVKSIDDPVMIKMLQDIHGKELNINNLNELFTNFKI